MTDIKPGDEETPEMSETARIRWHEGSETDTTAWFGYVGTVNIYLFQILRPVFKGDDWVLTTTFPGVGGKGRYATDGADSLKTEAEHWLAELLLSLGGVFPPEPAEGADR